MRYFLVLSFVFILFLPLNAEDKDFIIRKNLNKFNIYSPSGKLLFEFTKRKTDSLSMETLNMIFSEAPPEKFKSQESLISPAIAVLLGSLLSAIVSITVGWIQGNNSQKITREQIRNQQEATTLQINTTTTLAKEQIKSQLIYGEKIKNLNLFRSDITKLYSTSYELVRIILEYQRLKAIPYVKESDTKDLNIRIEKSINELNQIESEIIFLLKIFGDKENLQDLLLRISERINNRTNTQDYEKEAVDIIEEFMKKSAAKYSSEQGEIEKIYL